MAGKKMYSISCIDAGTNCDFHVCDSNEDEVLAAAQDHARRAHGENLSIDDIRKLVKSGEMAACH